MKVILAVSDLILLARLSRIVHAGIDNASVDVANHEVGNLSPSQWCEADVILFGSGTFVQFLDAQRAVAECASSDHRHRMVFVSENVTSALVYRVVSLGLQDVIDTGCDDQTLLERIRIAGTSNSRNIENYLVPGVDANANMTLCDIAYIDDIDRQIVWMVAAGYTDREIAEVVHFSHQVVRNRVSSLLLRSGLRNRTQLAAKFTMERLDKHPPPLN